MLQGWPKIWANLRLLIGIYSQNLGPIQNLLANPVICMLWRVAAPGAGAPTRRGEAVRWPQGCFMGFPIQGAPAAVRLGEYPIVTPARGNLTTEPRYR